MDILTVYFVWSSKYMYIEYILNTYKFKSGHYNQWKSYGAVEWKCSYNLNLVSGNLNCSFGLWKNEDKNKNWTLFQKSSVG